MAEPRKVPFVTLSSPEPRKRRREDEAGSPGDLQPGGGGAGVLLAKDSGEVAAERRGITVRLNLRLSEPSDQASAEFNYCELLQALQSSESAPFDPSDPFGDDEKERREVEALARKFESKYGGAGKKRRKDRLQDLIDIGFGYDETDPFIDNSEAYDELVPASLTTKLGGFYINTGTLQFRQASESEGEEGERKSKHYRKMKDGEDRAMKKRKRKDEGSSLEKEKKPRKNRVPKQPGVSALNAHRPDKKKRKKLMKDSLSLAAMLRRFTREKEEMRKKQALSGAALPPPQARPVPPPPPPSAAPAAAAELAPDPAVMSLLGSATDGDMLQDLLADLDFDRLLDASPTRSPEENGALPGAAAKGGPLGPRQGAGLLSPPPLPEGLPAPLLKRIEDLRAASRQFDEEGRKKFFTLDMNNILLDIELQVQEQSLEVRAAVYSHLEAFVPCNKEALLKRLKKLNLNIQDDRLRNPLMKLKLAVCSVMPDQIARYNMDCQARAAKQQGEEGDRNGSEEEDEEKPGRRVMGPRKKFVWDERLRALLCNLVRVKLGCYELESQCALSVEDYLKAFMETEVKPLWPKGWMQARMLFKESRTVHSHLTGNPAKKKIVPVAKSKSPREGAWVPRPSQTGPLAAGPVPAPSGRQGGTPQPSGAPRRQPSPPETICLDDSLDEALAAPSLDSISQALALLSSAAKGLVQNDSPPSSPPLPPAKKPPAPAAPQLPAQLKKEPPSPPGPTAAPPSASRPLLHGLSGSAGGGSRNEGFPLAKAPPPPAGPAQAPRQTHVPSHSHPHAGRATPTGASPSAGAKPPAHPPAAAQKPRPPPTASPLVPPTGAQSKPYAPVAKAGPGPPLAMKGSHAAVPFSGRTAPLGGSGTPKTPQQQQQHPQTARSPHAHPKSSPSPSLAHPAAKPPHHQPNFVTPMQATLTKSSHSTPPIIKLTNAPPPRPPRPPAPRLPASPAGSYAPKPSFRPPYAVQGAPVKSAQSSFGLVGCKPAPQGPSSSSSPAPSVTRPAPPPSSSPAPSSTRPAPSPARPAPSPASSPAPSPSVNHRRSCPSPAQRSAGVAGIAGSAAKPVVSRTVATPPATQQTLTQVTSGGGLLATPSSLPLMSPGLGATQGGALGAFGMLGGLVPVSLPFQFPLLNFTHSATGGATASTASASSGYSLAQNLLKSLQSGPQVPLPPHLQHAFSDSSQSQGGEVKRKSH
ncbi:ubinuclein-2a isoform X2 [Lepisosteus oculatus]|uniref:ubinuclein-2a isoform X2 n=1 Tax=Lepisosteus oculatus TaxID=7918 RepID=UPI0035F51A64